jgi:hypothetical protein
LQTARGVDMGMNTAMIVRNDFLHDIKDDPAFGQKVWTAICANGDEKRMPYLGQAFTVLSSSHADYVQIIAIGGNCIRRVGFAGGYKDLFNDEALLRRLADDMGFRLVKKRER